MSGIQKVYIHSDRESYYYAKNYFSVCLQGYLKIQVKRGKSIFYLGNKEVLRGYMKNKRFVLSCDKVEHLVISNLFLELKLDRMYFNWIYKFQDYYLANAVIVFLDPQFQTNRIAVDLLFDERGFVGVFALISDLSAKILDTIPKHVRARVALSGALLCNKDGYE